jgi:hypothetical protein
MLIVLLLVVAPIVNERMYYVDMLGVTAGNDYVATRKLFEALRSVFQS